MSRTRLLPRLNALGVAQILERTGTDGPSSDDALGLLEENSSLLWFAPSGGTAAVDLAGDIARGLREIAERHGFPQRGDTTRRAAFDVEAAIWLGPQDGLATGEGLRDDVWAFLTSVLLPDVVAWRYPDLNPSRFAGGVRNCFQRLWVRGSVLDQGSGHPDRWRLVETLSEDAMVQIFERASISSDARLARSIASAWVATADRIGRGRMEDVMRKSTKYLRLRNEIIDIGFLETEELDAVILDAFRKVAPDDSRQMDILHQLRQAVSG